ncbi:hypothetical protein G9A89_002599 [Geosiphon pyriformis]|nr:hypothetical protein G9A89_002599 [Geosiphon pyriformis]
MPHDDIIYVNHMELLDWICLNHLLVSKKNQFLLLLLLPNDVALYLESDQIDAPKLLLLTANLGFKQNHIFNKTNMVIPDHSKLAPVASLINRFEDGTDQTHPAPRPRSPGKINLAPGQFDQPNTTVNITKEGQAWVDRRTSVSSGHEVENTTAAINFDNLNGNGATHKELTPELEITSIEIQLPEIIEKKLESSEDSETTFNTSEQVLVADHIEIVKVSEESLILPEEPSNRTEIKIEEQTNEAEIENDEQANEAAESELKPSAAPVKESSKPSSAVEVKKVGKKPPNPVPTVKKPPTTTGLKSSSNSSATSGNRVTATHAKKSSTSSTGSQSSTKTPSISSRAKSPSSAKTVTTVTSSATVSKTSSATLNKTTASTRPATHSRTTSADKTKTSTSGAFVDKSKSSSAGEAEKPKPTSKTGTTRPVPKVSAPKSGTSATKPTVGLTGERRPKTVTHASNVLRAGPTQSKTSTIKKEAPKTEVKKSTPLTKTLPKKSNLDQAKDAKTKAKPIVKIAANDESEGSLKPAFDDDPSHDNDLHGKDSENEEKTSQTSHEKDSVVDPGEAHEEEFHEHALDEDFHASHEVGNPHLSAVNSDVDPHEVQETVSGNESHEDQYVSDTETHGTQEIDDASDYEIHKQSELISENQAYEEETPTQVNAMAF